MTLGRGILGALVLAAAFEGSGKTAIAAPPLAAKDQFATPLRDSEIDLRDSGEWVSGAERPLPNPTALRQLLWTQSGAANGGMLRYGAGDQPGPRHLRLAFGSPLKVGSVLVRGGDQVSVLREDAPLTNNLANESLWVRAERLGISSPGAQGSVGTGAGPVPTVSAGAQDSYALWVLPPGTSTRALRFSHVATASDSNYAGTLSGIYLLSLRYANIAPQAWVTASANEAAIPLLTDSAYNSWLAWDNGPDFRHVVTAATPESITLIWPREVILSGLAVLWAGFNAAHVEYLPSNDPGLRVDTGERDVTESAWRPVGQSFTFQNQYPRPLGVDWMDFGKPITTRGVRLRLTATTDENHHPHLAGKTKNGRRVWLGEIMAVSPLGEADLASAVIAPAASGTSASRAGMELLKSSNPPIPIHFTLHQAGNVTLVIDDAQGNRVRNLLSDSPFPAGQNTAWWDGTDDLGRNLDAATHGVYLIPTHFVSPGHFEVHGLVHQPIDLHYEFSVYNAGHPAWETADGKGGWLTNHTPPSSALFVPAGSAPGGKPLVYLGSYVSEGGAGLAWVDLDGNKQGGRGWVGGNWTAAPYLARDGGAHASRDTYAYVAGCVGGRKSETHATEHGRHPRDRADGETRCERR